ncbi:MAG: hypothetical protein KGO50_06130, partial [Myxococcales bacterium]|nr:hypothetical protein [Myxococcales bacterium]
MARSKSGFDWGFWAKACLLVSLPLLAWTLWPGGQCLGQALSNEGFTALSADDQAWATLLQESGVLSSGDSMGERSAFQRLVRALGPCTQVAFHRSELWQWVVTGVVLLAAGLCFWLKYRQHRNALGQAMTKLAQTGVNANPPLQPTDPASSAAEATPGGAHAGAAPGRAIVPTPAGEPASRATTQQPAAVKSRFTASQAAVGSPSGARSGSSTAQHRAIGPGEPGTSRSSHDAADASRGQGSRVPISADPLSSLGGGAAIRQAVNTSSQRAVAFAFDDDWDDAPLPEESAALPNPPEVSATDDTYVPRSDRALAPTLATAPDSFNDDTAHAAHALAPTLAPTLAADDRSTADDDARTARAELALAATLVVQPTQMANVEADAASTPATAATVVPATVVPANVVPATVVPATVVPATVVPAT